MNPMQFRFSRQSVFILLVACFVLFWWRLGTLGLIDPDEPFYALTAKEMVQMNEWFVPHIFGHPQFEKPVGYYWMVAACYKVFGINEFAGRFPTAVFGTLIVFLVYFFTASWWNERAGFLSALVLASGLEFTVMSRLMLTDIALAFFIAASLFSYWLALHEERRKNLWILLHFVFVGLAVLTKGPVGWMTGAMATAAFLLVTKRSYPFRGRWFWISFGTYLLIALPWYLFMLSKFGWPYFNEFFIHENLGRFWKAEHPTNDKAYYYLVILAVGSLPWMPMLAMWVKRAIRDPRDEQMTFLWCWLWTSFIFLTCVASKLPSYIFYLFIPLAMCVGKTIDDFLTHGFRTKGERFLVYGLCVVQIAACFGAELIKVARPVASPAIMMGVVLVLAMVLLALRNYRGWIAGHAIATAMMIIGALTFAREHVDKMSSARNIAAALMEKRTAGEPILADIFLVRGIRFYTGEPAVVIANKAKPFNWTQHDIDVVVGKKGLNEVVKTNGSAWLLMREGDWHMWRKNAYYPNAPELRGRNLMVRAEPEPKKGTPEAVIE